jgi:hypothetical protein
MQGNHHMSLKRISRRIKGLLKSSPHKIALSYKPKRTPWGGGNQVMEQLVAHLLDQGHRVTFCLEPGVTAILLVDPRAGDTTTFSVSEIHDFKMAHPHVICVHRINECDLRKNTHEIDDILCQANMVADYTVFISQLRLFCCRWFDPGGPMSLYKMAQILSCFTRPGQGYCPASASKSSSLVDNWNGTMFTGGGPFIASGELRLFP